MVYSGNISAFRFVIDDIRAQGFNVMSEEYNDRVRGHYCMRLIVLDSDREILTEKTFTGYDEDVLINTATAWLRRIEEQLSHWRSNTTH